MSVLNDPEKLMDFQTIVFLIRGCSQICEIGIEKGGKDWNKKYRLEISFSTLMDPNSATQNCSPNVEFYELKSPDTRTRIVNEAKRIVKDWKREFICTVTWDTEALRAKTEKTIGKTSSKMNSKDKPTKSLQHETFVMDLVALATESYNMMGLARVSADGMTIQSHKRLSKLFNNVKLTNDFITKIIGKWKSLIRPFEVYSYDLGVLPGGHTIWTSQFAASPDILMQFRGLNREIGFDAGWKQIIMESEKTEEKKKKGITGLSDRELNYVSALFDPAKRNIEFNFSKRDLDDLQTFSSLGIIWNTKNDVNHVVGAFSTRLGKGTGRVMEVSLAFMHPDLLPDSGKEDEAKSTICKKLISLHLLMAADMECDEIVVLTPPDPSWVRSTTTYATLYSTANGFVPLSANSAVQPILCTLKLDKQKT